MASTKTTAAIYARYSSDLQNDRSVDDQIALCRNVAARDDLKIVATFSDRAKSGASLFDRDGLLELMTAAKASKFNVLIVESLDRLSRDQEDLAHIFKRLQFAGVEIRTINEGTTTPIHVSIRGLFGSMFLTDLANKVRRGLTGRVKEGKIPGAVSYGYRAISGKPGEREIDQDQAKIVRRIFNDYASGSSARTIAATLNREGIPGSRGNPWNFAAIINKGSGHGGMLGNPLYKGELIWNAAKAVLNPENGRKVKRRTPDSEHIKVAVPHLKIVDPKLWDAVAAMRQSRSLKSHPKGYGKRPFLARKEHLLSGLLRCGVCNGPMRISNTTGGGGGSRVACVAAMNKATCDHTKTYDLDKLQVGILDGMRTHLTDPQAIAEAARVYHANRAERDRKSRVDAAGRRKQLNRVQVQIDRLVAAITDSDRPIKQLTEKLDQLEAERVALAEQVRLMEADSNVVQLHPNVMGAYKANVTRLHEALTQDKLTPESRAAFRMLIDCIVVHRTGKRMPYEFTPYGRLSAIMGADLFPSTRSTKEILAAEGANANAIATGQGSQNVQRMPP